MTALPVPLLALLAGLVGLGFGLGYFVVLRRSVTLLLSPQGRALGVALTIGRLAAAVLLLWLAAKLGAVALLSVLGGFLAARLIALRRNKEAAS